MNDEMKNRRKLWLPKRPEMPTQCPSCPFLTGNDAEFGEVCNKIAQANDMSPVTPRQVRAARQKIKIEVLTVGDFYCHSSVYEKDKEGLRPRDAWRQCPGATKAHRGED